MLPRPILLLSLGLAVLTTANAQGPLPAEARETIHALAKNHAKLARTVTLTETGYTSKTTSDDPTVAKLLKQHVAQMKSRLDSGAMVRRWDPAFPEFVRHYPDMVTTIKKVRRGLKITVVGKTPEAIKVAQNHAGIISGFVAKGHDQLHETHPPALTGE